MLVSAFFTKINYESLSEAINNNYRFFSFEMQILLNNTKIKL